MVWAGGESCKYFFTCKLAAGSLSSDFSGGKPAPNESSGEYKKIEPSEHRIRANLPAYKLIVFLF